MHPILILLITLLVAVMFLCLVVWGVRRLLAGFSIGEPIASLVWVFTVILFVVCLISLLGGGYPIRLRL